MKTVRSPVRLTWMDGIRNENEVRQGDQTRPWRDSKRVSRRMLRGEEAERKTKEDGTGLDGARSQTWKTNVA